MSAVETRAFAGLFWPPWKGQCRPTGLEMHRDMTPAYLPDTGSADAFKRRGRSTSAEARSQGWPVGWVFETIAFDMRLEMPRVLEGGLNVLGTS